MCNFRFGNGDLPGGPFIKLKTQGMVRVPPPAECPYLVYLAVEREKEGDGMLRHGPGGVARHIRHRQASTTHLQTEHRQRLSAHPR
jgi:hypothetical protein